MPQFETIKHVSHPPHEMFALVADVEKIYGKVTEISVSEIESREYVTFHRQPSWLTFRLNYTGVFSKGSRKTTRYQPNAKILSITIAHP